MRSTQSLAAAMSSSHPVLAPGPTQTSPSKTPILSPHGVFGGKETQAQDRNSAPPGTLSGRYCFRGLASAPIRFTARRLAKAAGVYGLDLRDRRSEFNGRLWGHAGLFTSSTAAAGHGRRKSLMPDWSGASSRSFPLARPFRPCNRSSICCPTRRARTSARCAGRAVLVPGKPTLPPAQDAPP